MLFNKRDSEKASAVKTAAQHVHELSSDKPHLTWSTRCNVAMLRDGVDVAMHGDRVRHIISLRAAYL